MAVVPIHRIEHLESAQARTDRKVDALREKVIQVDDRIDRTLNAVIATHDKYHEFTARFDTMDTRFNNVDERFSHVDKRFNAMDLRLDRMDGRMERRFDAVDQRLDTLETRMERRFNEVDQRMDKMETVMVAVAGKLGVSVPV